MEQFTLDEIDLKLLNALQDDAAASNQALAARVHVSPPTCLRRVKRLRDAGLIEREIAVLNPDRLAAMLGHGLTALVEITLDRQGAEQQEAFEERVVKDTAVQQCYRVSPGPDFMLVVHVAGVQWQEIASFYGVLDDRTVYTVTHDDDGQTDLQFGGGARLPSGAVVNANYRFGAGAAVPPADSVKQLAKPVAGLRKMRNVLPAYGGADAEGPAELAIRGPRSALLLGRAISLVDIETAAAQQPGVRAAHAAWRWDELGLRPAVIVSYIGDTQLAPAIQATLRSLAEPDAPIRAVSAPAQSARLDVDVQMDPLHVPGDVIAAVSATLFAAVTLPGTGGLLRAERLGPDGVLFASVVVRAVMEVPGVTELRSLQLDRTPFTQTGRRPAAGAYFDFATGGVWVNGQRAT